MMDSQLRKRRGGDDDDTLMTIKSQSRITINLYRILLSAGKFISNFTTDEKKTNHRHQITV